MNKLEEWFLKRLLTKLVRQGPSHQSNIKNLYTLILLACKKEFVEDNEQTRNCFLTQIFNESLKENSL